MTLAQGWWLPEAANNNPPKLMHCLSLGKGWRIILYSCVEIHDYVDQEHNETNSHTHHIHINCAMSPLNIMYNASPRGLSGSRPSCCKSSDWVAV